MLQDFVIFKKYLGIVCHYAFDIGDHSDCSTDIIFSQDTIRIVNFKPKGSQYLKLTHTYLDNSEVVRSYPTRHGAGPSIF